MKHPLPLYRQLFAPNDGGTPPPAGGTPPPAGDTPPPAASTPPPAVTPWGELSPETKALVELKKFESPDAALKSYMNLEKMTGVPADQLLKLPADIAKAKPEELAAVFDRLGRPKDAKGYEFKPLEGKELDRGLVEFAGPLFHQLGLTKAQGENLATAFDKMMAGREAAMHQAGAAQVEQDTAALKTKWGAAFDQNVKQIREAAPSLGLKSEDIDKLQEVKGFGWTMEFLHGLAAKVGEDKFQGAENGAQGHRALSPDAAKAKIESLTKDPEFANKLRGGDAEARKLWDQLHIWAVPSA